MYCSINNIYCRDINYPIMKQPIIFSRVFQISCSFERQNLFHEKSNPFQDFTIPALDQETCGEFLHICPELRVFTLERNSFTEEDTWSTKEESEELSGQKIKPVPTKETSAIPKIKVATSSSKVERGPIKETYAAPKPKLPRSLACNLDQSTKAKSEEHLGQKIKPVQIKETSAIPKIKVATSSPKVERGPIKESYAAPKPKLPRSLAWILDNTNYNRSIGPRRTTKVSQEVWAASLGIKQEEPIYSSEKQMMSQPASRRQIQESSRNQN